MTRTHRDTRPSPSPSRPCSRRSSKPWTGATTAARPATERDRHRPRPTPSPLRLALVPGDGIGPEVVAEGVRVLDAVTGAAGVKLETTEYDLGARRWHATGETLPDGVLEELRGHDAILLGAVGDPTVPSGVLERGLLLRLRFALDHHVNLRPARLYPGVTSPLRRTEPTRYRLCRRPRGHRRPLRRQRRRGARGRRRTRSPPRSASTRRTAWSGSCGTPSGEPPRGPAST